METHPLIHGNISSLQPLKTKSMTLERSSILLFTLWIENSTVLKDCFWEVTQNLSILFGSYNHEVSLQNMGRSSYIFQGLNLALPTCVAKNHLGHSQLDRILKRRTPGAQSQGFQFRRFGVEPRIFVLNGQPSHLGYSWTKL